MKLVIGNKNYSSWSLRPWLLLSYHGIPFEEIRISLDQADTQTLLRPYTAAGKVPVLLDGDLTVWDSLSICEYISEHCLNGRGWPGAVRARAEARSCSAEMHSGFSEIRMQLPLNCRATERQVSISTALEREITRVDQIWSQYRKAYAAEGPWLFGEFSIADCMFAPVASRFNTYAIRLSPTATQYVHFVLDNDKVREWMEQARTEVETIEMAEIGLRTTASQ